MKNRLHRSFRAAAMLVLALLQPGFAAAQDTDPACAELFARVAEPEGDGPAPEEAKLLAVCDSEQLYYGERGPENLRRARHCAYLEREGYDLPTVSGPAVLMMIYANGLGVERSFELAQRFNCEVGGSPEEIADRRALLDAYAQGGQSREFDICDGVSAGFLKEICDGKAARLQAKPK